MPRFVLLLIGATALASACKPPIHLTYDFGRAYVETLRVQADLTRPSVQYAGYSLYGVEAAQIRLNALKASTDSNEAEIELENSGSQGQ